MRKLVLLFLLILLPLQTTWAAVSGYCQHEQDEQQSQHLGHHTHKHHNTSGQQDVQPQNSSQDSDCGVCHMSGVAAIPVGTQMLPVQLDSAVFFPLSLRLPFKAPETPDRPNWQPFA